MSYDPHNPDDYCFAICGSTYDPCGTDPTPCCANCKHHSREDESLEPEKGLVLEIRFALLDSIRTLRISTEDLTVYDDEWRYVCTEREDAPEDDEQMCFEVYGGVDEPGRPILDDTMTVEVFSNVFADSPFATIYRNELDCRLLDTPRPELSD